MITWVRNWFKSKDKPVKIKQEIIFSDDDKVKQLEPIYRPGYICIAKDCKCDNSCKTIIGWREK